MKILDVGCGLRKHSNAIGIDKNPRSQADVIHDLDKFPYPFTENEFDEVICDNVLEHLDDVIHVLEELHRITKPNGHITVIAPFFAHRNAFNDLTHRHFFGIHSFDYFVKGTSHSDYRYSTVVFQLSSVKFDKDVLTGHWFDRLIRGFANKHPDMYENRLAYVFPMRTLTFELTVVK